VAAHGTYKLSQPELAAVQGSYSLQDGRTLRVSVHQRHLYAELGDTKTEILPTGRNAFASADDAVRLVFNNSDAPTDVKVSTAQ
jgi:hypothetical protein